jgi:hypothetical protein
MAPISRRHALHAGLGAAAATAFLPRTLLAAWHEQQTRRPSDRPYLDAALRAEHWIRSVGIDTPAGRSWPCTPGDRRRGRPELTLYSGTPGVILFYLELHGATGEKQFLDEAVRGARELATVVPLAGSKTREAGLYEGIAGHMFTLHAVAKSSGRADLMTAAKRAVRVLADSAQPAPGGGVHWSVVTDIVSGSAGIGLALLAARDLLGDESLALARKTGDALLARAEPMGEGKRRWMMDESFPREMPNFSHGTAGVAYFLATLGARGGERAHIDAARDGARYLRTIAARSGDGIVIRHHQGDGEQLFYLSWCHGPAGTARLYDRLDTIEPAAGWRATEDACAAGTIAQGIPERRTPGLLEQHLAVLRQRRRGRVLPRALCAHAKGRRPRLRPPPRGRPPSARNRRSGPRAMGAGGEPDVAHRNGRADWLDAGRGRRRGDAPGPRRGNGQRWAPPCRSIP